MLSKKALVAIGVVLVLSACTSKSPTAPDIDDDVELIRNPASQPV